MLRLKRQSSSRIRGVIPAESTGKPCSSYCPGGSAGFVLRRLPRKPGEKTAIRASLIQCPIVARTRGRADRSIDSSLHLAGCHFWPRNRRFEGEKWQPAWGIRLLPLLAISGAARSRKVAAAVVGGNGWEGTIRTLSLRRLCQAWAMTAVNIGIPRRSPLPDVAGRPADPHLLDRFGRIATDLRVSVTEKCSLRCTYCMPEEGLPAIPRSLLLTPAEIGRLVGIGARDLGVREVRFTGGEPLLRADLAEILAATRAAAPGLPMALTTNGVGLDKRLPALLDAGLTRVNISLDTVDREHFARLTRRDRLPAVLAGIEAARAAGLTPLKVNAVLMRETLEDAPDLLAWALDAGVQLRFIEQMPLDADGVWSRESLVDAAELLAVLDGRFELEAVGRDDPHAPAEEWRVDRVERPRPRRPPSGSSPPSPAPSAPSATARGVTAEGSVRACLFGDDETPLAPLLRGGADDVAIADAWRAAMWGKQAGHGMDEADFHRPKRSMGAIGG